MLIGGSDGRIHRYDPVNQVSLGSFNAGSSNLFITADSNGNAFYGSTAGNAIRQVRYGTGELVQVLSGLNSGRSLDQSGNSIYMLAGSFVRRTGIVGGSVTSVPLSGGVTWRTSGVFGNTYTAIGTDANHQIVVQSINLTTFTVGGLQGTNVFAQAGSSMGKASATSNPGSFDNQLAFSYLTSDGALNFGSFSLFSDGSLITPALGGIGLSGFSIANYMPTVTAGHSGWFVYGQDASASTVARISRFDLFRSPLNTYSYTIAAPGGEVPAGASSGYHVYNVVAPEPGTLLALGVGGLALLRRRRARS